MVVLFIDVEEVHLQKVKVEHEHEEDLGGDLPSRVLIDTILELNLHYVNVVDLVLLPDDDAYPCSEWQVSARKKQSYNWLQLEKVGD